jgi:hypothetical protein
VLFKTRSKTTEKERDQLQAQVAGAQDELARCRAVIGINKECIIELRNEAALARKREEEVAGRDAERYRPFVEEAQAVPELRSSLASAKQSNETLEMVVRARDAEIRRLDMVVAELRHRLDRANPEKLAPVSMPPTKEEEFLLLNVRTNEVIGGGDWDHIKSLQKLHPEKQPFMRLISTRTLQDSELESVTHDPVARQALIDDRLAGPNPSLRLLEARFPGLQDTGILERAVQRWGVETFDELKRREQARRKAAAVDCQSVPLTR